MLADRFSGARLGRLPSALAAPHGSPQGRGHLLSPLPALPRWMAGRCCLPLPSVCWGLCRDHSQTESLLWGCRDTAAAQAFSSMCILNPGNSPALAPLWPRDPISQVPLAALLFGLARHRRLAAEPQELGGLCQGLAWFPYGCPRAPGSSEECGPQEAGLVLRAGEVSWAAGTAPSQTSPAGSGCKGSVAPAGWAMPCHAPSSPAPTVGIWLCPPGCAAASARPALLLPGPGGPSPKRSSGQRVGRRGTVPDLPRRRRLCFAGCKPAGRGASLRLQHPSCLEPGCGWLWAAVPQGLPPLSTGDGVSLLWAAARGAPATPVVRCCWCLICASPASPCPCMRAGAEGVRQRCARGWDVPGLCRGCSLAVPVIQVRGESRELGGTGQGSAPKHV